MSYQSCKTCHWWFPLCDFSDGLRVGLCEYFNVNKRANMGRGCPDYEREPGTDDA